MSEQNSCLCCGLEWLKLGVANRVATGDVDEGAVVLFVLPGVKNSLDAQTKEVAGFFFGRREQQVEVYFFPSSFCLSVGGRQKADVEGGGLLLGDRWVGAG